MHDDLDQYIRSLPLDDEGKDFLCAAFKSNRKENEILEFKFKRTLVDKAAITNILNASIDEIKKQKKVIENSKDEINRTLTEVDKQKKLVDVKNRALNKLLKNLREAQQQLVMSEKMASLGQLTAGVAHEINNPINFVSANIKPLKEDLSEIIESIHRYDDVIKENKLDAFFKKVWQFNKDHDLAFTLQEVQELLKGIEEGAIRTSEIVKGLRNFSRLDQNVLKKTDINEGVDSTLALLHSVYKDHISIEKKYGTIPEVECFPGEINQVLMNILSNAIQAITGKGKIFITTWKDENWVKIGIRDTGSGMDPATKNKIFDPFFTTKEVGKGTGLGLSISYGIIKKHKGKIEVVSEIGQGTEFIISLPIHQNENSKIKSEP